MTEVLLTHPFREYDIVRFTDMTGYHFTYSFKPSDEELKNAEIILGQPTIEEILKAERLTWIQGPNAGVDGYMKEKERFPKNVVLTNLSGAFGQSISEFVLMMTLMLYKKMYLYRDHQRDHFWTDEGPQESPQGKNVLILGAGNIGQETAKLFRVFSCHITGMRRNASDVPECFDEMITAEELDRVLPDADIVVGALPDTEQTRKLLNEKRLSMMKETSILINVGRGSLIDADALVRVLNEGGIRGAALDVTDPEPLPKEHPLWDAKNVIITPHITGGTFGHLKATEEHLFSICRENLRRRETGEPLLNRVDFETGYRVEAERYDRGRS